MPLGFHAPSFTTSSVADALERIVDTLDEKRRNVNSYPFKSWSTLCDGLLEDLLTMTVAK
jgi:hypothetical protein